MLIYTLADSHYGTFDQGGNVWEWNDEIWNASNRALRGGSFGTIGDYFLQSSGRILVDSSIESESYGFRVSSLTPIPEPSVLAPVSIVPAHIVRFDTEIGSTYILQTSDDLEIWIDTEMQVAGDGEVNEFAIEMTKPKEFYRVRIE